MESSMKGAMTELLREKLVEGVSVIEAVIQDSAVHKTVADAAAHTAAALKAGRKLMVAGNGGSAADAQHIAAELMVRYQTDRPALSAIALTTNSSALTACGNDLGFEAIFERQIAGLGRAHDVAFGISTSGKSANVLRGLRQARGMGLPTVGMTGGLGGDMAGCCDALIVVPSTVTARIQEMHILIGHVLCKALERRLGLV
jgi:D-sedoheptulose 7-phosphate isomerase